MRHFIVSMLLVITLLAGGVIVLGHMFFQAQIFNAITVGVVLPEDASELKLISQVISSMDSVQAICDFQYMDAENAMEKLETGNIQAVISLPESLYQDIYEGSAAQITVYLPEDSTLNIQVFQEVLNDGVKIVQTAEASVFAVRKAAGIYEANMSKDDAALSIAYLYMEEALGRGNLFDENVQLPFGDMNLYQYYIAAGISLLLLIVGVNFSCLYQRHHQIIEKKLHVIGMGPVKVSLVRVLVMTVSLWVILSVGYTVLYIISLYTSLINMWFEARILLGFWLLAAAASSYFHLIYTVFGNGYSGSVFILLTDIIMVLCSGAVIPLAYMPDYIGKLSWCMPLNYWNQFCGQLLFGTVSHSIVVSIIIWIIATFMIGVLFTWNNISHGIFYSSKRG